VLKGVWKLWLAMLMMGFFTFTEEAGKGVLGSANTIGGEVGRMGRMKGGERSKRSGMRVE
jgi:hypothetical protein